MATLREGSRVEQWEGGAIDPLPGQEGDGSADYNARSVYREKSVPPPFADRTELRPW